MNVESDDNLLLKAVSASIEAGKAIMEVYVSDFSVEYKGDSSPLTKADRYSHEIIKVCLSRDSRKIPILSEEGGDILYNERKDWDYLWLVDPLDGTKEFIKRNGEFTVNIALIHSGRPLLGVIYAPKEKVLYFSSEGMGSYRLKPEGDLPGIDELIGASQKLPVERERRPFTVVVSRSHMSKETEEYINELRDKYEEMEIVSIGSSLKFCLVAEGTADVYPRFASTMEWDTGAGQAIIEAAGGSVVNCKTGKRLLYNRKNLINPWFEAYAGSRVKHQSII